MIIGDNTTLREDLQTTYTNYTSSGAQPGYNGLTGFKEWECFMLVKYGKPNSFGGGEDYEYLIELPLYPEQVSEQISANWTPQNILGRSSPIVAYANTNLKNVSFSLDLHRDLLTGSFSHTTETLVDVGEKRNIEVTDKRKYMLAHQAAGYQLETSGGPFSTRSWYVSINKMLQMSCYPQYTTKGLIPPTTYFIFGQMILKGFVQSYSTEWKKPIINTFYGWNSVTINMDCYPDSIISARDMIENSGKGNASTQNTYNTKFPDNVGNSNVMTRSDISSRTNARSNGSIGGQVMQT